MRQIALSLLVTGLISTSALAQEPARLNTRGALAGLTFTSAPSLTEQAAAAPAPEPAAPKKVVGTFVADIPSTYFFRGYRQEADPKLTFQPAIDVAFNGDAATFNVGLFNSFHTGSNKDAGYGYYETDFYAAATVKKIKATYTAYTYPNIDNSTIHELMFSSTFSGPLAPSVALAFELAKPAGLNKGIYLEGGINPAVPMKDAPVTVTFPIKVGLSIKDYYGDGAGFGYFTGGVAIAKPLAHGDIHGSVIAYGFGDTLKAANLDKAGQVVGSVGFTVTF